MVDELEELRQANPYSDELAAAVLLANENARRDPHPQHGWYLDSSRPLTPLDVARTRSKKAMAGALAAAAVVLAFFGFAVTNRMDDEGLIEASVASPVVDSDTLVLQSGGPGFDRAADLLVIHLDFTDRSDTHVAVASREVADWFNLEPVVVAGTADRATGEPSADVVAAMDAAWDDLWLDAHNDWSGALAESRDRWVATLDAGGHVWVAETGVSDFTADVVRAIVQQRPELATDRLIHVVQHSEGNEASTQAADLAFTQTNTAYRRIEPGDRPNSTADLTGRGERFEERVVSGPHGDRWSDVFDVEPADQLSFGDVVTLLDILGVATEHVANTEDYIAYFIGDQPDAALRGGS